MARATALRRTTPGLSRVTFNNVANELTLLTPPTGQPTTSLWDGNGNLLSENAGGQLTSYSWDPENRMVGVAYPTGAPDTMVYSNDGLRQKKVTGSGTTNAVWDEQNLLQEKDGSGITQAQYTDYPGYWGGLASQRRGAVSSFFGFDQQANTRLLASNSGAQTDAYLFKAFGEELATSGVTVNSMRFGGMVGYYRDLAARLYIRARHYEPGMGRWASQDPIEGRLSGKDDYRYTANAPVALQDPSGMQPECRINCSTYPGGPCAWVMANTPGLRGAAGTSVCCQGKRIICHWYWSAPPIVKCIEEHEKCHWPDINDCTHGDGPDRFRDGTDEDKSECRCHQVELRCLLDEWRRCRQKRHGSCDSIFRKRFKHVCRNIRNETRNHCQLPRDLAMYCHRGGL